MPGNGPPDTDVVCSRFKCFARRQESFLIARFCPAWPNTLDGDFDSFAELAAQGFDFMRTRHDTIDPCCCAQLGQTNYLVVDGVGDSKFAQRLLGSAC